jgi:hypothetical protein
MKFTLTVSNCIVRLFVVLCVAAGLVFTGAAPKAFGQSKSGFTYNGIAYTSYWFNEYGNGEDPPVATGVATDSLKRLAATGANYASLLATQYVQTSTSTTIAPVVDKTPLDDQVVFAVQNIHNQGLNVVFKPHVDSLDNVWRGQLAPTNISDWFSSYQSFIVHYATMAQANYVNGDVFVIGTEFASLSGSAYQSNWETIISAVRAVYSGPIAYASNATGAGDEFTTVSFWDKVDIIGVDGYFPLTNHADPTIPQLVAAWTDNLYGFNPVAALQNLQSTYNKPLIFTELGYESTPGTNEQPWNYSLSDGYDPTEQEDCYEAFFEVFSQQTSWMKGVFWWNWAAGSATTPYDPSTDTTLDPDGKPAGTVTLPQWYTSATQQSFALSASPSSLTVTQGSNGTSTISVTNTVEFSGVVTLAATGLPNGVTAAFATNPTTGSSLLTLTASITAAAGASTVTITGTSGSLTATTAIALTVNTSPSFTLSASPASLTVTQGGSGTSTISVTTANGFTGSVTLAATGLPSGVTAAFDTNPTTGSSMLTLTAASTATSGASTITIAGTSGGLTASTTINLTVNSAIPQGFAISAAPTSLTVTAGVGGTSTITVTPSGGFTGTVSLSCAITPTAASKPATCSLSPASVAISGAAQTSTLTVSTTAATTCSSALVHPELPGEPWYAAGGATLACLLLFGIPARRRSWRTMLGMLALLVLLTGGVLACGGGGGGGGGGNNCTPNSGTTAGTYTITVTGTSGTIVSSGTITLTVQ